MRVPTLVAGITREMKHLAERQRVIAQNIANSETPGFKARDVAPPNFADLVGQQGGKPGRVARPRVEITGGMAALGARTPRGGNIVIDHDVSETKPDGNNVTLEDQLLKMSKIQADFTAMTNLYRKQQSLMKTALGKGGGEGNDFALSRSSRAKSRLVPQSRYARPNPSTSLGRTGVGQT